MGTIAAAASWQEKPVPTRRAVQEAVVDGPVVVPTSMGMPCGTSTATSFHDPGTASGRSMSYHTIASPYWPLGTRVRISYQDRNVVGVVEDFGPAQWAVAQHEIPAIIDVSTDMMSDLTGVADNTVRVRFRVLEWGRGASYRAEGVGRDRAYSCQ
jgi:rare lipoprotein A (peptidoglycan hydrolase)